MSFHDLAKEEKYLHRERVKHEIYNFLMSDKGMFIALVVVGLLTLIIAMTG